MCWAGPAGSKSGSCYYSSSKKLGIVLMFLSGHLQFDYQSHEREIIRSRRLQAGCDLDLRRQSFTFSWFWPNLTHNLKDVLLFL